MNLVHWPSRIKMFAAKYHLAACIISWKILGRFPISPLNDAGGLCNNSSELCLWRTDDNPRNTDKRSGLGPGWRRRRWRQVHCEAAGDLNWWCRWLCSSWRANAPTRAIKRLESSSSIFQHKPLKQLLCLTFTTNTLWSPVLFGTWIVSLNSLKNKQTTFISHSRSSCSKLK